MSHGRPQINDPCSPCVHERTEITAGVLVAYCWWYLTVPGLQSNQSLTGSPLF